MIDILVGIIALIAGVFSVVAAVGIVRFPDALSRMHASSKVGAFVGALALVAAGIYFANLSATTKVIFAILFVFLTAPIGAHILGRAVVMKKK